MADQNNSPWQIVSESPASQTQPSAQAQPPAQSSNGQSSPWQVVSQAPQPQPFTDEHLDHVRALNDARPWWRKMLGLAPSADQMTPEDKTQENNFWNDQKERMKQALRDDYKAKADVPIGAVKAAGRSAIGADNLVRTGLNKVGGNYQQIEAPDALKSSGSFGQEAGGMFEGVLEFIAGDEALKTLSVAEKFGLGMKIAKLAEEHPAVAKLIHMGLNATRTATVGGAQEAVHGGDTGDILTAAGTGFASSVGSEGLSELSKLAKPIVKKIAGESLDTAPKWKGAGTAAKLAKANQEPAKRVIGTVARDSSDPIMQKFGQTAPESINSFRDAAQAVEGAAKPIFQKLDEISDGGFQTAKNELDSANKIMRRATSMEDLKAAENAAADAQGKIDTIFKSAEGKVSPDDLQNARSAWRSKHVLEELHSKIDQAFDMPQSASDISGAERTLDVSKLQGRLNAAFQKIPQQDLQTVLGKEGTKSLFDLAKLGADPARAKTLGEIAMQIGSNLSAGGAGTLAGAALGHAVPGGSIALGLHFLYSHPGAGALVAKGLSKGSTPKVVVPAVLQLIQEQRQTEPQ